MERRQTAAKLMKTSHPGSKAHLGLEGGEGKKARLAVKKGKIGTGEH